MERNDLRLLDCTLRDGGYINDWKWGYQTARNIIQLLVKAKIDVIEVGFLRDVEKYNPEITVCNHVEELNRLLPEKTGKTMFAGMIMNGNYDIDKLSPYDGVGIELIRVTAHDYDIDEGLRFACKVKEKGYKLSFNPINIMGYSDEQILRIVERINKIQPYQFSIVDTFGSMKRIDLDRIVSLVDNNLDRNIRIALHLHENMSLSYALTQIFVDKHLSRPLSIDGSLMGMGRTPGNLPIELIADYLIEFADKSYDIDFLMDAIQDYIAPQKGLSKWGYDPAFFLSARFNLHRNYAEHFLRKGDLTNRDINHLLARIETAKKTAFDKEYAECIYEEYKDNRIDDQNDRVRLKTELEGKIILVLAPGSTINTHKHIIDKFIHDKNPVVISINFVPDDFKIDYVFFSNNKRYDKLESIAYKTIVTSNIDGRNSNYSINYNSLTGAFNQGLNSFIMILNLLKSMEVSSIYAAGADGYKENSENYYNSSIRSYSTHGARFNQAVVEAIKKIGLDVSYITPSAYKE